MHVTLGETAYHRTSEASCSHLSIEIIDSSNSVHFVWGRDYTVVVKQRREVVLESAS